MPIMFDVENENQYQLLTENLKWNQ
jgi:hypothetical protein